ncbi:MAG TPA: ABC transporter substrate-binding protein [Thermotogota bacterium]|nr:ABC transporter substrate-binding protein [Thermotogota bacterium]HRW92742.1 ABC transporter substrate-binding protein [Thermotogota bacterium]
MKRAWSVLLVFLVLVLALGFGAGNLKFAIETEPVGLDPHLITAFASHRILENVYDGLLMYDAEMNLVPALAESFEIVDPNTVVFTLRSNVTFHDGSPLTMEDVLYSFERIRDPNMGSPAASYYTEVSSIRDLGDNRLEFKLNVPMVAPLLHNLAGVNSSIVSKEFVESGANMQLQTNGTGPFQIAEYVAGDHITLQKCANFYEQGIPKLDSITFVIIPEEIGRVSALRNGDVHLAKISEPVSLNMLSANAFTIYRQPVLSYYLLGLNDQAGALADPRVRRAISMAIDREALIKMVAFGEAAVTGVMNPTVEAWAVPPSAFPEFSYNPQKAKELLEEAGYGDGFSFSITAAARYNFDKVAQVIQAQLAQVGIQANLDMVEWGIFIQKWRDIDFDSFVSMNGGSVDPDKQLYRTFHSEGSTNKFHFSNARVDELLEAGRLETNLQKQYEIYAELQYLLVEESPFIFLYSPNNLFASTLRVSGFSPMPNESLTELRVTEIQ